MRSSGNSGHGQRSTGGVQAKDKKRNRGPGKRRLFIIGTGPGSFEHLSKRAVDVLKSVDTVAGYTTYIELIRPLVAGKKVIRTAMKKEVDRVEAAIEAAMSGGSCAIVSSGDAGIYAMAGLALEICKIRSIATRPMSRIDSTGIDEKTLFVEVIPGIPALCSGASLLGAPLTHDFAAISLSDLLTPWKQIEKRIEAAAAADFVIVIYNPKSKKRHGNLASAQKIILKYRDKNTPVGIVTGAMRENQEVVIIRLEKLHEADVGMQTTVFVGNSTSFRFGEFMITPRGYTKKYEIGAK